MAVFNLAWLRSPGSIAVIVLVIVNLIGGLVFLWSLFRLAIGDVRRNTPASTRTDVRPLLSLTVSLLIANAVALYTCDFHFGFLIVLVNLAVPVAWYLGRQVMLRHVAGHKES